MATNHTHSSLDLSALNSDVEYTLPLDITAKRCLIHVKLTESCSKVIDNLISSNKVTIINQHIHVHVQWNLSNVYTCTCTRGVHISEASLNVS